MWSGACVESQTSSCSVEVLSGVLYKEGCLVFPTVNDSSTNVYVIMHSAWFTHGHVPCHLKCQGPILMYAEPPHWRAYLLGWWAMICIACVCRSMHLVWCHKIGGVVPIKINQGNHFVNQVVHLVRWVCVLCKSTLGHWLLYLAVFWLSYECQAHARERHTVPVALNWLQNVLFGCMKLC